MTSQPCSIHYSGKVGRLSGVSVCSELLATNCRILIPRIKITQKTQSKLWSNSFFPCFPLRFELDVFPCFPSTPLKSMAPPWRWRAVRPAAPDCHGKICSDHHLGERRRKCNLSWGFPYMGVPPNGWFISWKPLLKWMIWGYPHFRKPPNLRKARRKTMRKSF